MARVRVKKRRKFENPDILQEVINFYFDTCDEEDEPYTITGLCLAVGITKQTFYNYMRGGPVSDVIRQARMIIEHQLELTLRQGGNQSSTIFGLKNLGWADRMDLNTQPSPEDNKWTIEVVSPGDKIDPEKDQPDAKVSNSSKVTPFPRKKKAV